ncbi:MAG TPA: cation:proton antiporter [Acidimicrobiales bacterium]|nr:cation:proton antiporter [Acidimicrobiales bacterium]
MTTEGLSFGGLLVVALVAVAAPLAANAIPRVKIPAVVLEILAGIAIGPSMLGWVEVDQPVAVLSLVGLAFLLFLAGLEIDVTRLHGDLLRLPLVGFVVTLAIGLSAGLALDAAGWVSSPLFVAIVLSATSLGLVVPVLKDVGEADRPLGQLIIAGATVADFAAVILLSLFFSEAGGGTASKLFSVGLFVAVVAVVAIALARVGRSMRLDAVLVRLQDTTAEIRVRIAVALLIGFVALAANVGLETILGAFVAGAILASVDHDAMSHPHFRVKLEAIGYGFVIPVFFVTSGVTFDVDALTQSPSALVRVPLFLLALLLARGVPALLYRRTLGTDGATVAALLQATSLPFIVTAAQIGVAIDAIQSVTAAALVSAGLLSVVIFPPNALARLRRLASTVPEGVTPRPPPTTAAHSPPDGHPGLTG